MKLSDKQGVQHIVSVLAALGLREVIICPGSRNAPLTVSFNRHPAFRCTSIRDERSAAFFALGKAMELQEPVAVLCTSGSAALNFAPAIAEAFYQRIPLIVLTADRPREWIGQSDGQTINQSGVYRNYIRKSYDLKGETASPDEKWFNERCLSEGLSVATVSDRGPVHFNIPLEEPLYGTAEAKETSVRIFSEAKMENRLSADVLTTFSQQFSDTRKVMILVGQSAANPTLQKELEKMAAFENVIVLSESTSNIYHPDFIENIDRCITGLDDEPATQLMPDLLITAGGAVISKRIKAMLRQHRPALHWNVDPFDSYVDTYQSLTTAVPMKADAFFSQLRNGLKGSASSYKSLWQNRSHSVGESHCQFKKKCPYSDLQLFYKLYETMPGGMHVHLANSSPVRYAQLFDNSRIAESWANRGTSGIDGSTSTAMGAAAASPEKDFLLITGDVAFYYDINAFWQDEKTDNLKIILINNGGGGIFRIISGPDKVDEMEQFFETSMKMTAENIAKHFKWNYLVANDEATLDAAMSAFFTKDSGRTILEVITDAETNPDILNEYWRYLKENSK